jgi:tetratricopeptide (TPR) repeat protein
MTTSLKHSATIEQFLANEMTSAEKAAFKKELLTDQDLAEELKLSEFIDSAIIRDDILELRWKLISASKANNEITSGIPFIHMNTRKWWFAAASVLLVCTLGVTLYLLTSRNISNDALFNEYYNSKNIVDQTRGDENIVEAVIKFQQKDYERASRLFRGILDKDNSNIAVWFYFGISSIETKKYENSINAFTTIINQNDNLYVEHAEWYLGLCYLKNNQVKKAADQFRLVAFNPDNFHRQEAISILDKLQPTN